jgi:hypothetical protein
MPAYRPALFSSMDSCSWPYPSDEPFPNRDVVLARRCSHEPFMNTDVHAAWGYPVGAAPPGRPALWPSTDIGSHHMHPDESVAVHRYAFPSLVPEMVIARTNIRGGGWGGPARRRGPYRTPPCNTTMRERDGFIRVSRARTTAPGRATPFPAKNVRSCREHPISTPSMVTVPDPLQGLGEPPIVEGPVTFRCRKAISA